MQKLLRVFAIILLLLSLTKLDAQDTKVYKDRIYLKQGSMLTGEVSEYSPGEVLILTLRNGKQITIADSQLRKVVMYAGKTDRATKPIVPLKEGKIFYETQFSFLTNSDGTGYSIGQSILYQQNQLLSYGMGVGLDNYYASPGREILPVFASAKFNLSKGNRAPYIGMKMGYGFAFKRDEQNITEASGGLMTNPYFGIRMGARGLMINFFAGLKFQKVDYEIEGSREVRREDILHRRLEIGTSIMF